MPTARSLSEETVTAAARAEMAEHGSAGLTLRGTARRLGVSAPALYRYFPQFDELITAVILDVLADLRAALDSARAASRQLSTGDQILAICRTYRRWALAHPTDFQLAFAEPIPGYSPPELVSQEKCREPFLGIFEIFAEAHQGGELEVPPEYAAVPRSIKAELAVWRRESGIPLPDPVVCLIVTGWARIHGLVSLEMFGQSTGIVGDGAAFFDYEVRALLARAGIPAAGRSRP